MQQAATRLFDEEVPGQIGEPLSRGCAHGWPVGTSTAAREALPGELEEAVWRIGAAEDCEIRLQAATDCIAQLVKRGPRVFLRNLGSREDVLVNGERLARRVELELTPSDDLNIAGTTIVIEPRYFRKDIELGIDTSPLYHSLEHRHCERLLCDGVFLRAKPGTLTAILGPVGCGKSVLLSLLNGDRQPGRGCVMIGGRYELSRDADTLNGLIGYVPQGDVLLPELTVRQSLDCRLRLRFPDMAARVRQNQILNACHQLGVSASDIDKFLDATIGTADCAPCGLSGGERKLANIAHELLLKPRVLILDEPTSGLSSIDAERIICLLQKLAVGEGITVVAVLHQPSRASFAYFNDLLVMAEGGRLMFYGPAVVAQEYLEQASEIPCAHTANPAEFILGLASEPREADRLVEYYQAHPLATPLAAEDGSIAVTLDRGSPRRARWTRQFAARVLLLVRRNACVLRADQANLWLTFGQVPVIGLLLLLAFGGLDRDGAAFENLARKAYLVSVGKEPYQERGDAVPVEHLLEGADPRKAGSMISVPAARRRGAVYFILVAASVWFGILGGCREIVAEKPVLRREQKIGLDLKSYLAAKTVTLAILTGLQTAGITALVVPILLEQPFRSLAATWGILWLVAVASAALGFMVSCLAPTQRFALTAVPLLMIPQMILGGMLRPEADLGDRQVLPRMIGWLTIQRWGFEAVLNFDTYGAGGVMIQECSPDTRSRYGALDWVRFHGGNLPECFFAPKSQLDSLALPVTALIAASGALLIVAHGQLRRTLSNRT